MSRAASARYDSCAVYVDRYRPLSSSVTGHHFGPQPAWLLQSLLVGLAVNLIRRLQSGQNAAAQLSFGLRRSEHNGRASQSSQASHPREHLVQSRRTYLPNSEWQCSSVPVVLFYQSCWRAIAMRLWSSTSDQLIVLAYSLVCVGRRAFPVLAAFLWNSYTAHLTSAPSLTVFRQRLTTFFFRRSYADLIIWHSELTCCCGPSSKFVIHAGHIKNVVDDEQAWH